MKPGEMCAHLSVLYKAKPAKTFDREMHSFQALNKYIQVKKKKSELI